MWRRDAGQNWHKLGVGACRLVWQGLKCQLKSIGNYKYFMCTRLLATDLFSYINMMGSNQLFSCTQLANNFLSPNQIIKAFKTLFCFVASATIVMEVSYMLSKRELKGSVLPIRTQNNPPANLPQTHRVSGLCQPSEAFPGAGRSVAVQPCMPRFLCLRLDPPPFKKDSRRRPLWIGTDSNTLPRVQNIEAGTENVWMKNEMYGPHLR